MFRKEITWIKLFDSLESANNRLSLGRVTTIEVNNKKICLAHNEEGFFAVSDRCPHNGASLGNGFCTNEGSVVCPVHRYHFDLKNGRARSGLGDAVRTYPIEVREDGIYIGFEKTVFSLF
ncbi:MAG: Rieske (2Fe-2S) protein [Bacteroidia bacterium]